METPSKDGKSLPMFTPKNSDGSQRVIKQIMVIDPNKLRVAGLDLKMAEALKKSKGKGGNTISNRTKDDKLALAKTLLNRKLKQAKSSKETQNQNVAKEKCDSPQRLQASVAALQSLLSSPRTFITPSPKQPHTMLVNILESDQRTGSIELTISNKPPVQQEKSVVEQIPKASIKMTKPIKINDAAPKTIESMVISPEVKFEIKRKSLPPNTKRICSTPQSDLPKVIESKVLSPEEKIDMKTLCGSSTKPVPATVKIEITKQEIVQRKTPVQVNAVIVKDKPKECVLVSVPKAKSDKCLQPSPKHTPKKSEPPLPAVNEESAVDFINSLQMNATPSYEVKSKAEPKIESSVVQEDATSFLMSLFGQQSVAPILSPEVKRKVETKAITPVEEIAKRNEPSKQRSSGTLEKNSTIPGHRRNLKPVPIIKHKPRLSGTTKAVKATPVTGAVQSEALPSDALPSDALPSDTHPLDTLPSNTSVIEKELPKIIAKEASIEPKEVLVELPTAGSHLEEKREVDPSQKISASADNDDHVLLDKTVPSSLSTDKKASDGNGGNRNTELVVSEKISAGLSSTIQKKNSSGESKPKSIQIPKLEEVKSVSSVSTLGDEEISKKSVSIETEQEKVANESVAVGVEETGVKSDSKLVTEKLNQDMTTLMDTDPVTADAADPIPALVEEKFEKGATVTSDEVDKLLLEKIKSKDADQSVQEMKDAVTVEVEEFSAKIAEDAATIGVKVTSAESVDNVVTEELSLTGLSSTGQSIEQSFPGEVKCDSIGTSAKGERLAEDTSHLCKGGESVEIKNVPSGLPVESPKPETAQPPVKDESEVEKKDLSKENLQLKETKVEPQPSAPPPAARRKGKKSVPILIAKLNRSRKPASTQEKPKENVTQVPPSAQEKPKENAAQVPPSIEEKPKENAAQVPPTVDKAPGKEDESLGAGKRNEEAAGKSGIICKVDEPTNTPEETDEKTVHHSKGDKDGEVDKAPDPASNEKEAINSNQPVPQENIIISRQSVPQEGVLQEPLHNQCEPVTSKKTTAHMAAEEIERKQDPVKEICSEETVTSQSEAPCVESCHNEAQEGIVAKEDAVETDPQPVTKEISITSTEEIVHDPQEKVAMKPSPTPVEHTDQDEGKQLTSPTKLSDQKQITATPHNLKSPEKKNSPEEHQKENKTVINLSNEPTCILKDKVTNSVLRTEAKARPSSRVRKKSLEQKTSVNSAPGVEVVKTDEDVPDVSKHAFTEYLALSLVESPKIESPKCKHETKRALSSKKSECEVHEGTQSKGDIPAVEGELSSLDKFDTIREEQVVKNESSSLQTANKDDESDEFDHCDSDFIASFQDATEIEDSAQVDESSSHVPEIDFDGLKTGDEKVDKPLYESKEDLVFLGFNEKEIEEGQQSTSLRLSQSEDVSPLKSPPHSDTPSQKKTTPKTKRTPLSVGKKQKAEPKNWKKNSAKSLQNWLKSSDKGACVKEDDAREVDKKEFQEQTSTEGKEVDGVEDPVHATPSAHVENSAKTIASAPAHVENDATTKASALAHVENNATIKAIRGKKKKGKQDEGVHVAEEKKKPEKSSKGSMKTDVGDPKEAVNDLNDTVPKLEEHTQNQSDPSTPARAVESKPTKKATSRGQKKKSKKGALEADACATRSDVDEPKSSSKSTKDEQFLKLGNESSEPTIREQKKKSKRGSLAEKACVVEGDTGPMSSESVEVAGNVKITSKRKLEPDFEESIKDPAKSSAPTPAAPVQKRKYQRRSLKDAAVAKKEPAASETKTPKSSRNQNKTKSRQLNADKEFPHPEADVKQENSTTPLIGTSTRKRKAPKCETETPSKVTHISADTDHEFATPTSKQHDPGNLTDTPDLGITPKSGRKYKHSSEFNPRLLLIRKKEDLKSDEPIVDPTLQMVPKSKDDVQCGLCMGYTSKKKWLQHVSEHYGVGWFAGTPPPLNIQCRSSILNYMVEFFKTSKVKGLNCRICLGLRRSALGLLTHIEQCCLTEEELKDSRMSCEHCQKEYSKNSMVMHLRSCTELWKKNRALNQPEADPLAEAAENEVVLSNTGRLKRKSVIKAEHKFKDMDKAEVSPEELIKHIPQPRKDNWEAAWRRDIKSFGRGFCTEKRCEFTAETVEELQEHCQYGVCPHFLQSGYACMRCKFLSDNMEATRKHVLEKHLSPPVEDFKASDDDAVISAESLSEDGSSGDEEGSEKSAAEPNGKEKRKSKKKKKPSKRKRVHSKRNPPYKDMRKLVQFPSHGMAAEVARLHKDFIKHNYSEKPLFSYAVASVAQTLDEDIEAYFAKSPVSPKFALNGFIQPFAKKLGSTRVQPDQWQQLQRLNGTANGSEHVTYLGGPVKALAWVPIKSQTPPGFQYLASVTRKDPNKFPRFLQPKQSRSLVCIHRYQINDTEPNRIAGQIYYALAIDDGPIHCMEFLPSGGYDPETNRLGLLAVGTVMSEIKVYSLPLNVQKRDCDMFPILRIEPSFVLSLELDESEDDSSRFYRSQCISLLWSEFAGHNHIVAGYLNGFVSIWDIDDDEDNLNRFLVNGVRKFVPISYFWTKDERIRRVAAHYDMNGLRWLVVCNAPRRLIFYDLRDITKPIQIMDERTKNDCSAIDWPVVWANPAFALGDAMPTHGNCLSSISPSALGFITKKFERFCSGVTDLHFNPWNNTFAGGSENGDVQVTPLRDTNVDAGYRRKRDDKILTSLDIVALTGDEINEPVTQASRLFEVDYKDKYGIVFGPIRQIIGSSSPDLYSTKREPPLVLSRLTRVHQLRFNLNQKSNALLAVGYVNGLLRILRDKWEDPVKSLR